ncbi:MAG TPA: diacylglycerol kinase [Bacillota bacterium]|nr:diacylglycerol kinase [Bacillota bacterium]
MKSRTLLESFNYAFEGILYALKTQRNMRLHFVATVAVLLGSLVLKIKKADFLILILTIAFVVVAEMINTAIEATIDLITKEYHPLAAVAKNVAAGAVLVAATIALVVGYLTFFPVMDPMVPRVINMLQQTPAYLALIALFLTVIAVIAGKSLLKRGTPMQGGMPSGHAALSSAAATAISLISHHGLITMLAAFLVFLVAESRVEKEIHSWPEVLAGGLIGFLLTLLVFQIMV